MKIAILSRNTKLYSTRRLFEEIQNAGHEALIVDHSLCDLIIEQEGPSIIYKGQKVEGVDAIIPRIGASVTFYGTAVVRQFELMGAFSVVTSQAIVRSRDKLRSLQILSKNGLGMPKTAFTNFSKGGEKKLIEQVGGAPVIIKLLEGTQGLGVVLAETKKAAQEKLTKFNAKIGYPDVWRDYSCLDVKAGDLVGNMRRSSQCEFDRMVAKLGQPVDRTEWGMTPQTVNAYYSSTMNEIVFPAAILQPPFFNVEADDAVNYGAIGGVIGHEFTHGFDDQGRRSDGDGNLRDWWTEQDAAQFQQRAQLMVDQYSSFNPIDDLRLQGALGLGENIADLGGLTVSYKAYQDSLQGKPGAVIDGFTPEQRFFMGWGQVWRIKFRDEALRQQVITGPHSPGMYRVLGTLSNMPQFYDAYNVKPGDGMYRDEKVRVKIW